MLAAFTVNSSLDNTIAGDGFTTLREAIEDTELTQAADEIYFASNVDGVPIVLTQGELSITNPVTIDAQGQDITIDASGNDATPNSTMNDGNPDNDGDGSRVFNINLSAGNNEHLEVSLTGLTITGGDVAFDIDRTDGPIGGGGGGGGIDFQGSATSTNSSAMLTIADSTITDNFTGGPQVSVAGTIRGGAGGGILAHLGDYSAFIITDSIITGNGAIHGDGGGLQVNMPNAGGHLEANGSVFTMERTRVESNSATGRGGGIYLSVLSGGIASIEDSIITGNDAGLTLSNPDGDETVQLQYSGGGIYAYMFSNLAAATLTIAGSEISGNTAGEHGGGLAVCTKRESITPSNPSPAISRLSVFNTTISGNQAGHTDIINVVGGTGGGVHLAIFPHEAEEALVAHFQNVTITENTADTGGGIYSFNQTDPLLDDADNDVALTNTIISGNKQHDGDANNFWGSINAAETAFNLFGHDPVIKANTFYDHGTHLEIAFAALGAGNLNNGNTNDPGLGPLQFNGGFTRTHRPQTGSPAIDAGLNSLAIVPFTTPSTALDYDQRGNGFDRFYDVPGVNTDPLQTVDIGAYEISLPKVIEVVISASNSGEEQSYFDLVNRLNESNGDQILALPFTGADTITILFSEPVIKFGNELGLESIRTGENYDDFGELAYLANESTPTKGVWKLHDPTPNDDFYAAFKPLDQVLISLKDTIYAKEWGTAANAALDGEWINPASLTTSDPGNLISEFPSGNGTTGGEFRFVFTTDPLGDYDGDGMIGQGDLDAVLLNWGALEADIPTAYPMWVGLMLLDGNDFIGQDDLDVVLLNWGFDLADLQSLKLLGDFNGDGFVGQDDMDLVFLNWGDTYDPDVMSFELWGRANPTRPSWDG